MSRYGKNEKKRVICPVCQKTFSNDHSLARHHLIHTGEKPFACPYCDLRFTQKCNMKQHCLKLHHGKQKAKKKSNQRLKTGNLNSEKAYTCEHCLKAFTRKHSLGRHMKCIHTKSQDKPYQCEKCSKLFTQKRNLARHIRSMHTKFHNEVSTNQNKSEDGISSLKHGVSVYTEKPIKGNNLINEKPYSCKQCLKSFSRKRYLCKHEKLVHQKHATFRDDRPSFSRKRYSYKNEKRVHKKPAPSQGGRSSVCIKTTNWVGYADKKTGMMQYKCKHCSETFKQEISVKRHSLVHFKEKDVPFKCDICKSLFLFKSDYERHMRHHPNVERNQQGENLKNMVPRKKTNQYNCRVCSKSFIDMKSLFVHSKKHGSLKKSKYACKKCNRSFKLKTSLLAHSLVHRSKNPNHCKKCEKTFTSKNHLKRHAMLHTGERPYQCDHCGKKFIENCQLTKHLQQHTKERPHKCDHCHQTFTCNSDLTVHVRIHTGEKPYKCHHCPKEYGTPCLLTSHLQLHTVERPYKCVYCQQTCTCSGDLEVHMKTHAKNSRGKLKGKRSSVNSKVCSQEKLYKCRHCNKVYTQRRDMILHRRTHLGECVYKCHQCEKVYTQKGHLNRHSVIHKQKRLYKCKHCGKTCRSSDLCAVHMITCAKKLEEDHGGKQSNINEECKKTTLAQSTSAKSEISSKKSLPSQSVFNCKHCGKSCTSNHSLNRHLHNVHKQISIENPSPVALQNPIYCGFCEFTTHFIIEMTNHYNKKHSARTVKRKLNTEKLENISQGLVENLNKKDGSVEESQKIICHFCEFSSDSPQALAHHLNEKHFTHNGSEKDLSQDLDEQQDQNNVHINDDGTDEAAPVEDTLVDNIQNISSSNQVRPPQKVIYCSFCQFSTDSAPSLAHHFNEQHSSYDVGYKGIRGSVTDEAVNVGEDVFESVVELSETGNKGESDEEEGIEESSMEEGYHSDMHVSDETFEILHLQPDNIIEDNKSMNDSEVEHSSDGEDDIEKTSMEEKHLSEMSTRTTSDNVHAIDHSHLGNVNEQIPVVEDDMQLNNAKMKHSSDGEEGIEETSMEEKHLSEISPSTTSDKVHAFDHSHLGNVNEQVPDENDANAQL
ncbi:uncharacterized protein LOC102806409 [Saccoglossus kowalevskii]|uniref:Zinc finger protein 91-like n=1 Tax=Saccoglossus kowalevskii TaxID=10224 RepID=A0ABM0MDK7_SACKO|nr:PREDICTED: zinc finger protein 91-like [Saccoglossus kowalevskii]